MHVIKFDKHFSRRYFLETAGKSAVFAGMLAPLWDVIARDGDISKAYPDEALSIENLSNGGVKPGGMIDASNVESVRHLLDPITFIQISQQGRVVKMAEKTTTDIYSLNPRSYVDATLRNRGKALLDAKGNVIVAGKKPWIGGNPFPDGGSAHKVLAAHVLSWGRRDSSAYPVKEWDMSADGEQKFHYNYYFVEVMATGRTVLDPKPYMTDDLETLRYHTALVTAPAGDLRGVSVVNHWPYDQTRWPDFFGYLPAFKRVSRFPTMARFESMVPGSTMCPTDVWMTGDPFLTWGHFKLKGAVPWLGGTSDTWQGKTDNWEHRRVGGKNGRKFFDSTFELIPEVYAIDMEPVTFTRSPYAKKRVWFDARTMTPFATVVYNRQGKMWKSIEAGTCLFKMEDGTQWPEKGDPYWSWTYSHSHDVENDYISIFEQAEHVDGGFHIRFDDADLFERFCTIPAIRRLGSG
jgi:hypothetical protein